MTTILPEKERFFTLDVIRGFALCGILIMNISAAGLADLYNGGAIHFYPVNQGDYYSWFLTDIFAQGRMRCLFSFLFGAGVLIFATKETGGSSMARLYYKRLGWLFLFGMIDLFLFLWHGDILFSYALAGIFLFPLRRLRPIFLFLIAIPCFLALGWFDTKGFLNVKQKREKFLIAENELKAGKKLSAELDTARHAWLKLEKQIYPFSDATKKEISNEISEDITLHRQPYWETFLSYSGLYAAETVEAGMYVDMLENFATMLMGMILFKWGFLSGGFSFRKYMTIAAICGIIGFPLAYLITHGPHSHDAHNLVACIDAYPFSLNAFEQIPRLLIAIFYASILIMICKKCLFAFFTNTLANMGRMAFTNYLVQNIIYGLLFYGFTANLFMYFTRNEIYAMIPLIWLFQAIFSNWWCSRFNMGPFEWLWRSLTYGERLSNRKAQAVYATA